MAETKKPRTRARRWIARLILLFVSLALTIAIAEVALRLLRLYRPVPRTYVGEFENAESKNFVADPVVGWRMRPGHRFTFDHTSGDTLYASDQDGFRIDPARPAPRDPRRLVVVGDSFTYGAGVAAGETFAELLAGMLGGWSLTNAAQPGYAFDQVWQALVHVAIPRKPDLVVVGIYAEDFERSLSAYRSFERMNKPTFKLESGRLVPMTADDRPGAVKRFLEAHSRVFTLLRQVSTKAGLKYGTGGLWNLNAAMIDDMIRVGNESHVPVVFLYIPPETLDSFPALAAHMKAKGALFVDPLDALKNAPGPLYLPQNGHLNAAGHRVVAEELAQFLRARPELLPRHIESRPDK